MQVKQFQINTQFTCLSAEAIMTPPTIISAGAVTSTVITASNGEKNNASKKNPAVTTEANPDLPPTPTPAVDSTNDVVVDVPTIEPTTVADASANNALPARGNISYLSLVLPVSQQQRAFLLYQRNSTNKNVKMTTSISNVKISPKLIIACPNVEAMLGAGLTISLIPFGASINPKIIPTIAVMIIP